MSAFMVGKQHIDLMVDATTYDIHWSFSWYHEGTRHERVRGSSGETARHNAGHVEYSTDAIGRMLIDENLNSIHPVIQTRCTAEWFLGRSRLTGSSPTAARLCCRLWMRSKSSRRLIATRTSPASTPAGKIRQLARSAMRFEWR